MESADVPGLMISALGMLLSWLAAFSVVLAGGEAVASTMVKVKAAVALHSVTEVANAARIYDLMSPGASASTPELVRDGYLRSVPRNPTGTDMPATIPDGDSTGWVSMRLVEDAGSVCTAIARQSGASRVEQVSDASSLAGDRGCAQYSGSFYAYSRI